MTISVYKVRIGVQDQERAKRFWVDRMGCDVAQDETYGDERWLEVRLPDGIVFILEQRGGNADAAPAEQAEHPGVLHGGGRRRDVP